MGCYHGGLHPYLESCWRLSSVVTQSLELSHHTTGTGVTHLHHIGLKYFAVRHRCTCFVQDPNEPIRSMACTGCRRILRKPAYMTRETHTQTLKDAKVHTILSTVRRQRLVLWQAILLFDCLIALRACVWGPLPWGHPSGMLETPRLRQLREDLEVFLNRTGTNTTGWDPHRIVQDGIHKLRGAKKKHIDQVLNYDCSHLGERHGLLSEENGASTTTCDLCQKTCKGGRGLRMHRIKTHGIQDERRACINEPWCVACLDSFASQKDALRYANTHYQKYMCVESKTQYHGEVLESG